jgi:hypothetical protein
MMIKASKFAIAIGAVASLLAGGSAVASAAETGIKMTPDSSIHAIAHRYDPHPQFYGYRGFYDYAGPQAGYGWYDYRWDPNTWNTGNGYY